MGGTITYVWWQGQRLTSWMLYRLLQLDADLRALFGVGLLVRSAIRLHQEQIEIFLRRYVTARHVGGRRVYDTRWWNGELWYRISPEGTVAAPGSSNHEIQGDKAAADIADTGSDAGIASRHSVRGRWIRANAWKYDLVASGDGFDEGWHFDILGIFRIPPNLPAGGGTTKPKEWDEMATKEEIAAVVAAEVAKLGSRPSQSVRTVHARVEGATNEWTLGDPLVGQDLDQFDGVVTPTNRRDLGDGVFEFRGFLVTADSSTGVAWARIYAKGNLGEHSRTDRAGYIAIQKALSLVATVEAHG